MKPIVSIIMGSTSDLPVMEKAAKLLDEMQVPFEMNALSAHRTPAEVEKFANLFKAISNRPNFRFELVSGDKIKEYYHVDSYASEERGSLGASCMKHDSCQDNFDINTPALDLYLLGEVQ
jgi:hypothetical protein